MEATADWEDEVFCPSAKVMRPGCTGEFLDSGVTVLDSGVTDRGSRESLVFVGLLLFWRVLGGADEDRARILVVAPFDIFNALFSVFSGSVSVFLC